MARLQMKPTLRKPAGVGLILLLIIIWAAMVASLSPWIAMLWWPLEALVYLAAGIVWILPLRPLLRWMELGKWRE